MIETLLSGKLQGQPEQRTSKNGKPYVQARMRVAAGAEETHFARLIAFSDTACTALLALADGDALAVAGTLKVSAWIDKAGEPKPNLDLVVSQLLTAYAVKRKREAVQPGGDAGPGHPTAAPSNRPARRQAPAQRGLDYEHDFGDAGDDAWLRSAP